MHHHFIITKTLCILCILCILLLLVVVVASREERRTFGLTIIIVSFSSCTLSLSPSLVFSLLFLSRCLVVVVVIEQKRRNCGADRQN